MSVWDLLDLSVQAAVGDPTDAVYGTGRYQQDTYGATFTAPWVDLKCSVIGLEIIRTATRDPVLTYRMEPGILNLTLHDPTGRYNPANVNGPHYGRLAPRLPVRVLLSGPVATALADRIRHDPAAGRTTIAATDGIAVLASVTSEITRPAENSVARLAALHDLGAAGSPLAPALVTAGAGIALSSATLNGDIWSMMLATAQADRARLMIDGSSTLRYDADWDRIASTPVATIGCPHQAAVHAHAQTWTTTADNDLLVNMATARSVGTDGETDQERSAADPASIQRRGPSSGGADVVLPLSPADLQKWADDAVRLGANPTPYTDTLGITLLGTEPTAAADLAIWWALEIGDSIRWYGHGESAGQLLAVTGIRHTINEAGQYDGSLSTVIPLHSFGYNAADARYDQGAVYA